MSEYEQVNIDEEIKKHNHKNVERDFTYRAPKGDQPVRYGLLRDKAKEFAHLIVEMTPSSHEQAEALSLLNLAVMSANAAIARHE